MFFHGVVWPDCLAERDMWRLVIYFLNAKVEDCSEAVQEF